MHRWKPEVARKPTLAEFLDEKARRRGRGRVVRGRSGLLVVGTAEPPAALLFRFCRCRLRCRGNRRTVDREKGPRCAGGAANSKGRGERVGHDPKAGVAAREHRTAALVDRRQSAFSREGANRREKGM